MRVRPAVTDRDLDEVRRLFRAFVVWHHGRQGEDLALVSSYFDEDAWEAELDGLPGEYGDDEGGALLVAELDGKAVGCVALRRLGDGSCEMKRMYVDDAGRGHGVGRALADSILAEARARGYREMLLDTSVKQHEAIGLYRSLGFTQIEPYHDVPAAMRDWLVYFRLAEVDMLRHDYPTGAPMPSSSGSTTSSSISSICSGRNDTASAQK